MNCDEKEDDDMTKLDGLEREREGGHKLYFPFDKNEPGIGKSKLITSTSSAVPTRKKTAAALAQMIQRLMESAAAAVETRRDESLSSLVFVFVLMS